MFSLFVNLQGGAGGGGAPRCAAATLDVRRALLADLPSYGPRRDLRLGDPSLGRGPGAGGLPGAAPRPAPSSRLRTGADQGNPTV